MELLRVDGGGAGSGCRGLGLGGKGNEPVRGHLDPRLAAYLPSFPIPPFLIGHRMGGG
jgi:hypothetical protein